MDWRNPPTYRVLNPLGNEAYMDSYQGPNWIGSDNADLGVRIQGVVPEPATMSLLTLGLVGLIAKRRRQR